MIEATKTIFNIKLNEESTLFAFQINNLTGMKCRVIVWGDLIKKVEPLIKIRNILHIDGAIAVKKWRFNKTAFQYELQIVGCTKINVLETNLEPNLIENSFENIELVNIKNIGKFMNLWISMLFFI